MKYGKTTEDNDTTTSRFRLFAAEPFTAKNGYTKLVKLYLEDVHCKRLVMTGFEKDWEASLWNGLPFDQMREGDWVDVTYTCSGKYLNFKNVSYIGGVRCETGDEMPF